MVDVSKDSRRNSRINSELFQEGVEVDVVNYYYSLYGESRLDPELRSQHSLSERGCWVDRRYVLQSAVSDLLPGSRAASCSKHPIGFVQEAVVGDGGSLSKKSASMSLPRVVRRKDRDGNTYLSYEGLARCGNTWVCPHCVPKIAAVRRKEIDHAIRQWRGERYGAERSDFLGYDDKYYYGYWDLLGREVRMILLTVPHQRFDNLESLLDRLKEAFRWMKRHRSYHDLSEKYGLFGTISVLEVTYGFYGWHPHFHVLWFLDRTYFDEDQLKAELFDLWSKAVKRFGFGELSWEGFGIQDADFVSDYLTKFGANPKSNWRVEHELSNWFSKVGVTRHLRGLTPFDLLDFHAVVLFFSQMGSRLSSHFDLESFTSAYLYPSTWEKCPDFGKLFVEYAKAFKGRHQIQWSRGLKKYFSIKELSDQEAASRDGNGEMLCEISLDLWNNIVSSGERYDLLLKVKEVLPSQSSDESCDVEGEVCDESWYY